uniref:Ubiquitin-protein ligase E3 A n=1 Tax=Tetraselmis sp. GSL018 TaxID=582737 RepID=A0A061R666_9CHLO|eukprot:CAMPEP_0177601226 /NCGR_PEP_ID=MMETSP0419_2-20121207/14125_1 /TAXON_ID=582737 /ORGANISM="Tetraselmis sp., Strain GSL018" /LENGTH=1351 /DNA_ID=CAMNT_0019094435 /DNA_START=38 /DNA_END=4093 /DNA_ORIENTATION=+
MESIPEYMSCGGGSDDLSRQESTDTSQCSEQLAPTEEPNCLAKTETGASAIKEAGSTGHKQNCSGRAPDMGGAALERRHVALPHRVKPGGYQEVEKDLAVSPSVGLRRLSGRVTWAAMSMGRRHAAGLDERGHVFAWGCCDGAENGQSGSGEPRPIGFGLENDERAVGISCGAGHGTLLTETRVYAWGSNAKGQCASDPVGEPQMSFPVEIPLLRGKFVTQVACGEAHTLCVTATSQVYAWGDNRFGQLGTGDTCSSVEPMLVDTLWAIPVKQLAAGNHHSAALTGNGFLFTWGSNSKGQLGLPLEVDAAVMLTNSRKSKSLPGANQKMLDAMLDMGISKSRAELALRETGNSGVEVAAEWLFTNRAEDDAPTDVSVSEPSASLKNTPGAVHQMNPGQSDLQWRDSIGKTPRRVTLQGISFVSCGGAHTVVITSEGRVMAWGDGSKGQLGNGELTHCTEAVSAVLPDGVGKVVAVACGDEHTVFLTSEGHAYACGDNREGQLGLGSDAELCETVTEVQLCLDEGSPGMAIVQVCAAGNSSGFILGDKSQLQQERRITLRERLEDALDGALQQPKSGEHSENSLTSHMQPHVPLFHLLTVVKLVFSSAAAMSAVFGLPAQVGIDVVFLDEVQSKLVGMGSDLVNATLYKSTLYLLDEIYHKLHLMATAERVQVMLAASQSPLLGEPKFAAQLLPRLCTVILSASSRHNSCRQMLHKWWAEFPAGILYHRLVQPLQSYLTSELMKLKKLTNHVMNCIKLLDEVFRANQIGRKLKAEDFHNELISEKLDVLDHYVAWRQSRDVPSMGPNADGPFSFCSYPFLLNCKAKSKLLHTEAKIRMETTVAQARMESSSRRMSSKASQDEERVLPAGKTRLNRDNHDRGRRHHRHGTPGSGGSSPRSSVMRGFLDMVFGGHSDSPGNHTPRTPVPTIASDTTSSSPLGDRVIMRSGGSASSGASTSSEVVRRQVASAIHRNNSFHLNARQSTMNLPVPSRCGVPERHQDHCIVRVRRTHILADALEEIARQRKKDLLKPLRVHFIGEDGIDAGGVRKELFQLLINDLLRPDYGMLNYFEDTRIFWFNPNTLEAEEEFMLVGIIMGLAIYNNVLLDLPLPQALYKKLLKQEVGLRDLEDMQPMLGRSLKQLLQYEGPDSVEDVFCQTFSVDVDVFGEVMSVELKPGGSSIAVTEDNRREFVELYVDYILNESVKVQFDAFSKGFLMVCGGPALNLFHAQELETLVCGEDKLDFNALRKNAKYDGGYNAESQAVVWLWEVLLEFSEHEKHQFLKFFTGSDRAPIGGLGSMRSIIQRDGTDSNKLPTSHTCFNTLLLPEYSSKEKMESRLRLAILNAEGFGLE